MGNLEGRKAATAVASLYTRCPEIPLPHFNVRFGLKKYINIIMSRNARVLERWPKKRILFAIFRNSDKLPLIRDTLYIVQECNKRRIGDFISSSSTCVHYWTQAFSELFHFVFIIIDPSCQWSASISLVLYWSPVYQSLSPLIVRQSNKQPAHLHLDVAIYSVTLMTFVFCLGLYIIMSSPVIPLFIPFCAPLSILLSVRVSAQ